MNTRMQPEPVCPYCGHVERDAWEINFGPGVEGSTETSCNSCGKDYFVQRDVSVYYTTQKLRGEKGEA